VTERSPNWGRDALDSVEFYEDLLRDLDGADVVPCDDLLDTAWVGKTPSEVERLEQAATGSHGNRDGLAEIDARASEEVIHQRILAHIRKLGRRPAWTAHFGCPRTSRHALPSQRPCRRISSCGSTTAARSGHMPRILCAPACSAILASHSMRTTAIPRGSREGITRLARTARRSGIHDDPRL